jgi:cell division protein ZipA
MDKEILRIVIIATGLVVVLGMIAWSYLKGKKVEFERDLVDENAPLNFDELLTGSSGSPAQPDLDDFDIIPRGPVSSTSQADRYFESDELDEESPEHTTRLVTPSIIQFSLVAEADEGFNGIDLFKAFENVGLEYGSMKIFERIDTNRLVDFGVACMVEPGTFPDTDLENFYCPGVVFFMQPGELENAQAVFDDFVETMKLLAAELDGVIWDHQKQPLTEEAVQLIYQSL